MNLQNARKIADFPYPYPLAQVSMILQLLHWVTTPFAATLAMPRGWAVIYSFFSIFTLWCIHFNALDLEFPFGSRINDLPMNEFQQDWNRSILTLLDRHGVDPPAFQYNPEEHDLFSIVMSDASELYVPATTAPMAKQRAACSMIIIQEPEPGGGKRNSRLSRIIQPQSLSEKQATPTGSGEEHAPAQDNASDQPLSEVFVSEGEVGDPSCHESPDGESPSRDPLSPVQRVSKESPGSSGTAETTGLGSPDANSSAQRGLGQPSKQLARSGNSEGADRGGQSSQPGCTPVMAHGAATRMAHMAAI